MLDFNKIYEKSIYRNLKRFEKGKISRKFSIIQSFILRIIFNCDFGLGIKIGKNVKIPHAVGIVIGSTAVIEDNVVIMPNVVIGSKNYPPKNITEKRHATIRKNCLIGANSTIIGDIEIGENSIIAAGSIVTRNIPSNSIVTGINKIRTIEKQEK